MTGASLLLAPVSQRSADTDKGQEWMSFIKTSDGTEIFYKD